MAFEHGKKIVLTCVSASPVLFSEVRQFRTQILGHAKVIAPKPAEATPGNLPKWLYESAERADLLIVFFMAPGETESVGSPAVVLDGTTQLYAAPEVIHVTPTAIAQLPGSATVLVAVFRTTDRAQLPKELSAYRVFDLSSSDAREALLCAIAHDPVRAKRASLQEAAGAVSKIVIGYVATIVGNFDKTREFFIQNVNETVGVAIHYCMIVVVAVLLFTGFWSLLQLALDTLAPTLRLARLWTLIEKLPGRKSRWAKIAAGVVSGAIVIVSFQFIPGRLDAETVTRQHLRQLSSRLEASQAEGGGIREHQDHGVAQAWVTAQTLVGLLGAGDASQLAPHDVQRAYTFLDRTRIAHVALRDGTRDRLQMELSVALPQADMAKLPARFSSVAMAANAVGRVAGHRELPPPTMTLIFAKISEHFAIASSMEGWGYFDQFESGITEITAWVTLAQIRALRQKERTGWSDDDRAEMKRKIKANLSLLESRELQSGRSYSPVNNTSDPAFGRTYSTIMVLWALAEASRGDVDVFDATELPTIQRRMRSIVGWLDWSATADGWKVNPSNPTMERPFIGLTNQTLCILSRVPSIVDSDREKLKTVKRTMLERARTWSGKRMNDNDRTHDSDRYLYPTPHVVESSTFLWYPWSVCAMQSLSIDASLTPAERQAADRAHRTLRARSGEFGRFAHSEFNYVGAEGLIGLTWAATPPIGGETAREQPRQAVRRAAEK